MNFGGLERHDRQACCIEHGLDPHRAFLMAVALPLRDLEVPDRIDDIGIRRDITAETAECLRERALDHINTMQRAFTGGDAGPARSVHAGRMDLIDIGHGAIALGEAADAVYRCYVTVHRVESFEHDQLRPLGCLRRQQSSTDEFCGARLQGGEAKPFTPSHAEAVSHDGKSYIGAHLSGGIQARPVGYDAPFKAECFADIP